MNLELLVFGHDHRICIRIKILLYLLILLLHIDVNIVLSFLSVCTDVKEEVMGMLLHLYLVTNRSNCRYDWFLSLLSFPSPVQTLIPKYLPPPPTDFHFLCHPISRLLAAPTLPQPSPAPDHSLSLSFNGMILSFAHLFCAVIQTSHLVW